MNDAEHHREHEIMLQTPKQKITQQRTTKKAFRRGTCPICRKLVKFPSVLSYLSYHQAQAEEQSAKKKERERLDAAKISTDAPLTKRTATVTKMTNEKEIYTSRTYVDAFLKSPAYVALCNIEYHGINNMRRIRKEITETYSVLSILQIRLKLDLNRTCLVDLCSGKSLTTVVCQLEFPRGTVLAVDKLDPDRIPHHVPYWRADIMNASFAQRLEERLSKNVDNCNHESSDDAAGGAILVGMHLCGILSVRAIDLFQSNKGFRGLLLCPCCLPKHPKGDMAAALHGHDNNGTYHQRDDHCQNEMYLRWVDYLHEKMKKLDEIKSVERYIDHDMHSNRNRFLWVER